jgi:hypothetical protein
MSSSNEIPESFIENKNQLKTLVTYIQEQLWMKPSIISFLNEHTNDLFNIPDPIDYLILLKKIFRNNSITRNQLWFYFPQRSKDIFDEIAKIHEFDEGNTRSKITLMKKLNKPFDYYQKTPASKAKLKKESVEINKKIKTIVEKENNNIEKNIESSIILENLTQEIIDKEELVLFNVSVLKKANKVLYTFIDKNNQKRYYTEPFKAKIYVSNSNSIFDNDYIEDKDPEKFIEYLITNYRDFTKLKYQLNSSYERTINL